ncbi:MAG: S1C family serine protease [Treponema sp.]
MKLYSTRQVCFSIVLIGGIIALGAYNFGFYHGQEDQPAWESGGEIEALQQENTASTAAGSVSADSGLDVPKNAQSLVASETGTYTLEEKQNISVYERTNEAVVNITTETMGINWFLEPIPLEGGSGSGSIIDSRGYVLTNGHVIDEATKVFVSLSDGSQYKAKLIGIDRETDLAVLKFDPPQNMQLTAIKFGESDRLKVGQRVLAIGNPFGLTRTLTVGIVSALGRPVQTEKNIVIKNMIQTDTAINPGNSGGPLLDAEGRMVGINTMIYSTSGSSAGVGFAVPVNTAKRVVAEIIKYGKVRRASIDAELVQLNASIANYAELPVDKGLLVSRVKKGSNAEQAGLRGGANAVRYGIGKRASVIYLGGDIITAIANQPITSLSDYYSILEDKKPEETIPITVLRGSKTLTLNLTLSERED